MTRLEWRTRVLPEGIVFLLVAAALLGCGGAAGTPDITPSFAEAVDEQRYLEGDVVDLTLPEASGGNGSLSYSLTPTIPGLTFDTVSRRLKGTLTKYGRYELTYQATDSDANTAESDAATLTFTIAVQPTEPPFHGTTSISPDVITSADPTVFLGLTYRGTGTPRMFDRRIPGWAEISAYLFDASFEDGLMIQMQVNAEFGSRKAAEAEAEKYATYIGKLPTLLRVNVETSWIHKGDESFGGGNENILIHVDRAVRREN